MNRVKRHKVKTEKPEASTSHSREQEKEHDLAYYIHDRVELMHQVFSALKYKEIKALAPACVRHISIDDLQELCLEELLGISSKRLCAILDGAEPPSDTESSSQSPSPPLETISLDSISSDDEILSETTSSKKKKHKHHKHNSKSKKKRSKASDEEGDKSKASRAGLTVLELLELQARARAIRAQLQQEQAALVAEAVPATAVSSPSDNEVEIKEEPAEVVEISSGDEKPSAQELETASQRISQENADAQKRSKEPTVTAPQSKPRKIVLKRNRMTVSVSNKSEGVTETAKEADKKTRRKKKKNKTVQKDGSDSDGITLQLSDSEKMDLLGSLEQKTAVISTEDSESSSSDSEEEKEKAVKDANEKSAEKDIVAEKVVEDSKESTESVKIGDENNIDKVTDEKDKSTEDIMVSKDIPVEENENQSDDPPKDDAQCVSNEENQPETSTKKAMDRELSEGELSDRESSEVEALDIPEEIVCISDEETVKKKKKKDKKKSKKSKKNKPDFRNGSDQNFYKDTEKICEEDKVVDLDEELVILDSDDSSCYEVEGTILSKEPTAEEIEALSAKIDEIDRVEVVTDEQIIEHERMLLEKRIESDSLENISWKDRYLDSTKVKKVMSTSNILNAMRKKNIELKKKLEERKLQEIEKERNEEKIEIVPDIAENIEGTIELYNTLQGSTKYVDPVKVGEEKNGESEGRDGEVGEGKSKVTSDMKKDAKQLLKMFKRLKKFEHKMRKRL